MLIKHNLAELHNFLPADFTEELVKISNKNLAVKNGNIPKWDIAINYSNNQTKTKLYYNKPYLNLYIEIDKTITKTLIPWRKGPFAFNNFNLDSEWDGSIKWHRIKNHIDFSNKKVLDVGSGNGYFANIFALGGAEFVLGLEPFLLFNYQFHFIKNLTSNLDNVFLAPIRLEQITPKPLFDLVFSMGVLYHHKSPIGHLLELKSMLSFGGKLILETLIIDGENGYSLTPKDRYAGMRNVWFIPSMLTLKTWLIRCGFKNIIILDESITTTNEQRTTEFLGDNPKSLIDFVKNDKTIEGYPRPKRLMLCCELG